ncbi:hypothetical protein EBB54_03790 [Schaedlerella arabinosiphila]|uniref:Uncharacterized protein n=1 Tax=Schaedlerella arabinosiphila TaxID=2044587 RepID=A0A3R8LW48_9FIRM|nr:hypothetical protein EBB54_03790 [Schaedlerella arabinosiphila]
MFLSFKDNRLKIRILCFIKSHAIIAAWETKEPGGFPSYSGGADPPDERKGGLPMYVTYADLIQIGIFIVTLIGLCYTIFKGKKK